MHSHRYNVKTHYDKTLLTVIWISLLEFQTNGSRISFHFSYKREFDTHAVYAWHLLGPFNKFYSTQPVGDISTTIQNCRSCNSNEHLSTFILNPMTKRKCYMWYFTIAISYHITFWCHNCASCMQQFEYEHLSLACVSCLIYLNSKLYKYSLMYLLFSMFSIGADYCIHVEILS